MTQQNSESPEIAASAGPPRSTDISFEWLESLGFQRDGIGVARDGWRIWSTPEGMPPGHWQVRWDLSCVNRFRAFVKQDDLIELWRVLRVPFCP